MDIAKKQDKISELQQKIFRLEQENIDIISKYNNEIMSLRESKNSLESFKSNYYELKNQFDLIKMRLQQCAEDNHSLKKDIINLEKENKNINDIIDRFKGEARNSLVKERDQQSDDFQFNRNNELNAFKKNEITNNSGSVRPRFSNENVGEVNISSSSGTNSVKNYSNNSNLNNSIRSSIFLNNSLNENNQAKVIENNNHKKGKVNNLVSSILPSQAAFLKNESKILELENNLLGLQKKRDQVNFIIILGTI